MLERSDIFFIYYNILYSFAGGGARFNGSNLNEINVFLVVHTGPAYTTAFLDDNEMQ